MRHEFKIKKDLNLNARLESLIVNGHEYYHSQWGMRFFFLCIKAEISSHNQVDINLNLKKKKNQVIGFVMMQSFFFSWVEWDHGS